MHRHSHSGNARQLHIGTSVHRSPSSNPWVTISEVEEHIVALTQRCCHSHPATLTHSCLDEHCLLSPHRSHLLHGSMLICSSLPPLCVWHSVVDGWQAVAQRASSESQTESSWSDSLSERGTVWVTVSEVESEYRRSPLCAHRHSHSALCPSGSRAQLITALSLFTTHIHLYIDGYEYTLVAHP